MGQTLRDRGIHVWNASVFLRIANHRIAPRRIYTWGNPASVAQSFLGLRSVLVSREASDIWANSVSLTLFAAGGSGCIGWPKIF